MSRKETIKHRLSALNPHFLEVVDDSAKHEGHSGNLSGKGDSHFQIKISADILKKYKRIEQHRIINNLLQDEFSEGLHALSINII
jgi:BolA protein